MLPTSHRLSPLLSSPELKFTDKDGKLQARELTGTRDEIRQKVEADKSIPKDERHYVLRMFGSPGQPLALTPWDESELGTSSNPTGGYKTLPWFGWMPVPMDF